MPSSIYREVKIFQEELQTQGAYSGPLTGRYDEATHQAVKALVASGKLGTPVNVPDPAEDTRGLTVAAVADEMRFSPMAIEAIRTAYSEWASEIAAAPHPQPSNYAVPENGKQPADPEKAVNALQTLLKQGGFLSGDPDGVYESNLELAFGIWATRGNTTIDKFLASKPGLLKMGIKQARDKFLADGGQAYVEEGKEGEEAESAPVKAGSEMVVAKPEAAPEAGIAKAANPSRPTWQKWAIYGTIAAAVGGIIWWYWRKRKMAEAMMGDIDEDIEDLDDTDEECPCARK